ncbi:AMMECR1 domain-containing protein [Pavlovales sp. CCMP2436]|nr:AMMECR1 domain-containing protein [Pavlovales sp. CCMP2436]
MAGAGREDGAAEEHCVFAFDALHSHFSRAACHPPGFPHSSGEAFPLFVTWSKRDGRGNHQLRGCIGNLRAQPILAIKEYALSAALSDRRFHPIAASEVSSLEVTVSLLANFEASLAWDDWEVGIHGVWIDLVDPDGTPRNATYLPDVPPEQGWTVRETIDALVRKAGYTGQVTDLVRSLIRLTRYQSTLHKLSYSEYAQIVETRGVTR